eukprot:TRINITY_DN2013_c0_g1_i1.p1 TRINITY_DN2013_c0_g1~~TRINITY_DN2013_c0_g1_i1.p1  ORF type:complete len:433 (+),score=58.92 TRINITY_DN2013_c0_g1_i1:129-1427(+)
MITLRRIKEQIISLPNEIVLNIIYFLAFLLRIGLIIFGAIFDARQDIRYTDIDYFVFTEASAYVLQGQSPYERHTYRYTPLLSYIVLPSVWVPWFGKVLFALCDIWCAYLIVSILKYLRKDKGYLITNKQIYIGLCIWLFSPSTAIISSRGNSDGIVCLLVFLFINTFLKEKIITSALIFGLSVHFRIYPVIFAPAVVFYFFRDTGKLINWKVIKFAAISMGTLAFFTTVFYKMYGDEFLFEAFLYHAVRKDHRHNMSVYFNSIYLNFFNDSKLLMLFHSSVLVIQLLLTIVTAFSLNAFASDFEAKPTFILSIFVHTLIFVAFNKVITTQYFIWFSSVLSLLIPFLKMSTKELLSLIFFCGGSVLFWDYYGYKLEFKSEAVFSQLFIASSAILAAFTTIAIVIIQKFSISSSSSAVETKSENSDEIKEKNE